MGYKPLCELCGQQECNCTEEDLRRANLGYYSCHARVEWERKKKPTTREAPPADEKAG